MITRPFNLKVDGIDIIGQLYLPDGKRLYPGVCLCHGIPGGQRQPGDLGYPGLAERICRLRRAVVIFNFRGTGDSGGNLDIWGWTRDLTAVIDHAITQSGVDGSQLALVGFSAGAAVSVYVAANHPRVTSVAACACPVEFTFSALGTDPQSIIEQFHSIGVIGDKGFPGSIEDWVGGFEMIKPWKYVALISPRPLLLVHGSRDEIVAVGDAARLYQRAREPKQKIVIDGAGHRLRQDERAVVALLGWLSSQGDG